MKPLNLLELRRHRERHRQDEQREKRLRRIRLLVDTERLHVMVISGRVVLGQIRR